MINYLALEWKLFKSKFFGEENGAVDLIVIVILIAVVVVLGIAFKDYIAEFIKGIFEDTSNKANTLTNDVTF